eukprot:2275116-Rhodomonas_salina.1
MGGSSTPQPPYFRPTWPQSLLIQPDVVRCLRRSTTSSWSRAPVWSAHAPRPSQSPGGVHIKHWQQRRTTRARASSMEAPQLESASVQGQCERRTVWPTPGTSKTRMLDRCRYSTTRSPLRSFSSWNRYCRVSHTEASGHSQAQHQPGAGWSARTESRVSVRKRETALQ